MFSKMPWSHSGESHEEKEQEESLTTVLSSQEDRTELTLLIANCTETMRKTIVDTFDANQTGHKADIVRDPKGQNEWTDAVKADIAAQEKAQREQAAREKELSAPQMQETKNAALKFFDNWRENVISRVGEVVNSQEAARHQKERAHAQHHHTPNKRISSTQQDYEDTDKAMKEAFPPTETPLTKFDEPKRALILHSILLLMLSLEHYSAHSRVLLLHLTSSLHLSVKFLAEDESKIARGLLEAANMKADEETKKAADENASSRKWKVGLAAVGGATLLAVTGGLAAPLLAAGVGSVMGGLGLGATATAGYLGTMAGSSVIVGGLFGAYGARMSSQMMDAYAREVEDFAFIPVRTHHRPRKIEKEYRRLRVAIGISGWLSSKDDVVEPWLVIGNGMETFALRYELEALLALGNALTTMISSAAWGYAKSELIKRTVFSALTAALWPLGLLKISRIVDNPFSVAKGRSDKAGELLADALINKAQGERPVTLVGYSLGARVIYICLRKLAERKAFGLVESVVLLGAPTPSTAADWRMMRSVVSGRVVNVYSTNDYILGFLYRSSSVQYGIAGLQPIEGVAGVQNVDVTDLVTGHTSYRWLSGMILRKIGFEDVDAAQLKKQEVALAENEKREEEEAQRERAQDTTQNAQTQPGAQAPLIDTSEKPTSSLGPDGVPSDQAVQDLEKKVDAKNQESMMSWMTEKLQLGGATAATAAVKAKTWYMTRGTPAAGATKAVGQVEGQAKAPDVEVPKSAPQPGAEADLAKSHALGAEEQALGGPQL